MLPLRCIRWCRFAVVAVALLAAGCGSQSADERLNLKLDELKVSLEAHSTNRVMDILHQDFQANAGLNCDWARRSMTLMFLQADGDWLLHRLTWV